MVENAVGNYMPSVANEIRLYYYEILKLDLGVIVYSSLDTL